MLNMSSFLDMGMGCASETPAPFTAVAPASENEICGVSVVLLSLILLVGSHKLVFDQLRVLELSLYTQPLHHSCNFIVFGCLLTIFSSFTCPEVQNRFVWKWKEM